MSPTTLPAGIGLAHVSKGSRHSYSPGVVRKAIREAIESYQTSASHSHSLNTLIPDGSRVLIKPNWVNHINRSLNGLNCLVTHPVFVAEVIRVVSKCNPAEIVIADAPIQGCQFDELISKNIIATFRDAANGTPISVRDLRLTIMDANSRLETRNPKRTTEDYVLFDLGNRSLLEPISATRPAFRASMYDHRKLSETHSIGRHQYLIAREALDSDVILSLPKVKTHKKAGITGALKNLIGINGSKAFLPHHRRGGSSIGGDCYEGFSLLKELIELVRDLEYSHSRHLIRRIARYSESILLKTCRVLLDDPNTEGNWIGNDTVWRTVYDIHELAKFGTRIGTIASTPQRHVYSLSDCIICGQGEGPLAPEPLEIGCVTFASDPVLADIIHCYLLGLDPRKIPMLTERYLEYDLRAFVRDSPSAQQQKADLVYLASQAKLPHGWEGAQYGFP